MWLLVGSALAGEIQVTVGSAAVVVVDGAVVPFVDAVATAKGLSAGSHLVEIKNLGGNVVASATVDVPGDQQVRFAYKQKVLTQVGAGGVAAAAPAPAGGDAMDPPTFQAAKAKIAAEKMDLTRSRLVEELAAANRFKVGQVVQLLRLIDNEATRSGVVDAFAGRIVDPQNVGLVASAFDNSAAGRSAVDELD